MRKLLVGVAMALLLGPTRGAWAQVSTGNIYGTVVDDSGAVLPGAGITLAGTLTAPRTTTSDSAGRFRFLNLDHGAYDVTVQLSGFTIVKRQLVVTSGSSVDVAFPLKVAQVEEIVTVTAETPIVDPKKTGTSTTLTSDDLTKIPTSRDPWALLRTVPGVLVDRVNIGGNESGQQSVYTSKGSMQTDSMWSLDGVIVSDPAAAGASPSYYGYSAFDEINYTTGGSDVRVATGGLGINFVTKRGTNAFHGSLNGYYDSDSLQSSNLPRDLAGDRRLVNRDGSVRDKADHIERVYNYDGDLGGPILKDRLWFWGNYSKQDIALQRFSGTKDKTAIKAYNAKLNWQASANDQVSAFWFLSEKVKLGRSTGFAGTEDDTYLRNQGNLYPESGPHGFYKIEENHVFSPAFYVDAKYSYFGNGFTLAPRGGLGLNESLDLVNSEAHGSSTSLEFRRPQHTVNVDANAFHGRHEFRFGFGYRFSPTITSVTAVPGDQIRAVLSPSKGPEAILRRSVSVAYKSQYLDGYVADTYTNGRMVLNAGLRYDHQRADNKQSGQLANASFPERMPDLLFDGGSEHITWNDVSPRLALSYGLDASRKTMLRLSAARYAGQLNGSDVLWINPAGSIGTQTYGWIDANGDHFAQPSEVDFSRQLALPTFEKLETVNTVDPGYHAAHTTEAIAGIDRELAPNFSVGAALTWRKESDVPTLRVLGPDGVTPLPASDFVPGEAITSNGYTAVGSVSLSDQDGLIAGGQQLTNRSGYSRRFVGLELNLHKRLANKWMGRASFAYNDWTEHDGPGAVQVPGAYLYDPYGYYITGGVTTNVNKSGGQVASLGAGSGKALWFNSKWQLSGSALYQLPGGFDVAASLLGRQGFPRPVNITVDAGGLPAPYTVIIATPAVDTVRNKPLWDLDLRLSKHTKIGKLNTELIADAFNIFNSGTVLNRNFTADSTAFNRIDEILSPRILRFGARLSF